MDKNKDFLSSVNKQASESFQEEKFDRQKTNYLNWIIQGVIIAIAIVAAVILLNPKVVVLDFTNMTYSDVQTWAYDNDILLTSIEEYSNSVDEERILSQSIDAGIKMDKDNNIVLTVSKGLDPFELVSIPSFDSSWSRSSILNWLNQNGIEGYTIQNIESNEIADDYLISYKLIGASNNDFNRSSEIEFVVSQINQVMTIEMPDFLNSNLLAVDSWAQANGITYDYSYEFSSIYSNAKILYQSVAADADILIDETLILIVSKGEAVEVPSFTYVDREDAPTYMSEYGVEVEVLEEYIEGTKDGEFISQSIAMGEILEEDDLIIVNYSLGDNIVIPDFRNQLNTTATEWADNLNEQGANVIIQISEDSQTGLDYGKIYSQDIYNQETGLNTTINLVISSGIEIVVPDFNDMTADQANSNIEGINVEIIEEYKEGTIEGEFISQSILSGTIVDDDTDITVYYSLGDEIVIANFEGQYPVDFENWIKQQNEMGANITFTEYSVYDRNINYGKIKSQDIANQSIDLDAHINILWSLGTEYVVKDFMGMTVDQIELYAINQGLTVVFDEIEGSGQVSGTVIEQSPAKLTVISKNDFIVIKIAE